MDSLKKQQYTGEKVWFENGFLFEVVGMFHTDKGLIDIMYAKLTPKDNPNPKGKYDISKDYKELAHIAYKEGYLLMLDLEHPKGRFVQVLMFPIKTMSKAYAEALVLDKAGAYNYYPKEEELVSAKLFNLTKELLNGNIDQNIEFFKVMFDAFVVQTTLAKDITKETAIIASSHLLSLNFQFKSKLDLGEAGIFSIMGPDGPYMMTVDEDSLGKLDVNKSKLDLSAKELRSDKYLDAEYTDVVEQYIINA